jgi:AraC-like DNA-binding protein
MAYWYFRVPLGAGAVRHFIPLTGGALLAVCPCLGSVSLVGPRLQPLQLALPENIEFFGVHFRPGSTQALLNLSGPTLRDVRVEAHEVLGQEWVMQLLDRLKEIRSVRKAASVFDSQLTALQPCRSQLDRQVMKSVSLVLHSEGKLPMTRVAREAGLSSRQLRRRFRAATGLCPKELAFLRRVRSAVVDAIDDPAMRWIDIEAERGYADQPHLIREFKRTLGVTPVDFMKHARRIKHVRVQRG